MTEGVLVNGWLKLILTSQAALELTPLPKFITIVPVVSDPLIDTVPPDPITPEPKDLIVGTDG